MTNKVCPVCSERVIPAYGDLDSEILFVGSSPSEDEVKYNRPFTGSYFQIFRKELFKFSHLDLGSTRQVLVEYHENMKKDDCRLVSMSVVEKELQDKKIVIIVGADAVRAFTGLSISDVNGLDVTNEVYEFNSENVPVGIKFFAIASPQTVFKSLGEFRFGLQRLGAWLEEIK